MIYSYYWLESFDGRELKRVFAKETETGWDGWATSEEVKHSEMIKLYVTTWIKGLWVSVPEDYAVAEIERYWAEIEERRRKTKTW